MTNLSVQRAWDGPRIEFSPGVSPPKNSLLVQASERESPGSTHCSAAIVIEYIEARNRRTSFFEAGMFSDPAWDLLLWLYVAYLDQRRITIEQLTSMADVPQKTALKWIARLHMQGWITRARDSQYERRVFVALSFRGWVAFNGYFASCGYAPPRI